MSNEQRDRQLAIVGVLGTLVAAVVLAVAPLALPSDYSWTELTTSYAGAQGIPGAWVARPGFVVAGFGVLVLARGIGARWPQPAAGLQVAVGIAFVTIAVFSVRTWRENVSYNRTEDLLHGIASTVMGFAFAGSVAYLAWRRWQDQGTLDRRHVFIVAVTLIAPPLWWIWTQAAGLIQRLMLLMWLAWYIWEGVASQRRSSSLPADP